MLYWESIISDPRWDCDGRYCSWNCTGLVPTRTQPHAQLTDIWSPKGQWHYDMETFSALLDLHEESPPFSGSSPHKWPIMQSFDFFFVVSLKKLLKKKQLSWQWFATSWCSCDITAMRNLAKWGIRLFVMYNWLIVMKQKKKHNAGWISFLVMAIYCGIVQYDHVIYLIVKWFCITKTSFVTMDFTEIHGDKRYLYGTERQLYN